MANTDKDYAAPIDVAAYDRAERARRAQKAADEQATRDQAAADVAAIAAKLASEQGR